MKKKLLDLPLYYFLPFLALCVIGIIFGSFFDLQISSAIVNQNSGFGRFIESFGMLPPYFLMIVSGVLFFKAFHKHENVWLKILGYGMLIITFAACVFFMHKGFNDSEVNKSFGYSFNTIGSYSIAAGISLAFEAIAFLLIRKTDNRRMMVIIASVIIVAFVFQFGVIHIVKIIARRPRYRHSLGTDFVPWYVWNPSNPYTDLYKSYPSGHTGTAVIFLLFPLFSHLNPHMKAKWLLIPSYAYALLVPFFRVYYGAHYLSDVSFGGLICVLGILLSLYIGNLVNNKLTAKEEAPKQEE